MKVFQSAKCLTKNCFDEYIGIIAIIIGVIGYVIQIYYTEETLDVSSFSIVALFLGLISELCFLVQGYLKNSITITVTRAITFFGFLIFIVLWFVHS